MNIHTLQPETIYASKITAALCGDYIEITYSPELIHGGREGGPKKAIIGNPKELSEGAKETPEDILKRSIRRSQRTVRRLCNCNKLYVLWTLTYAAQHIDYYEGETPFSIIDIETQKDREAVLEHWRAFARKMRREEQEAGSIFRYVAIIEKHTGKRASGDKTVKNDTYHIHFLADKIYDKRRIQALWNHGLVNYSDWRVGTRNGDLSNTYEGKPPDNPGAYASKYLGKDMAEEEVGRKRYWASRNLDREVSLQGQEVIEGIKAGAERLYHRKIEIETEKGMLTLRTETWKLRNSPYTVLKKQRAYTATEKKLRTEYQEACINMIVNDNYSRNKEIESDEQFRQQTQERGKGNQVRNVTESIERKRSLDALAKGRP